MDELKSKKTKTNNIKEAVTLLLLLLCAPSFFRSILRVFDFHYLSIFFRFVLFLLVGWFVVVFPQFLQIMLYYFSARVAFQFQSNPTIGSPKPKASRWISQNKKKFIFLNRTKTVASLFQFNEYIFVCTYVRKGVTQHTRYNNNRKIIKKKISRWRDHFTAFLVEIGCWLNWPNYFPLD